MADSLDYQALIENALRGVMVRALDTVAQQGLQGDHHFYVTFRTDHPDVRIGRKLKARHPEEITIVMQNQFWDLQVDESGFSVGLSFDQMPQTLYVPFEAVTMFADPSVKFGLKFGSLANGSEAPADTDGDDPETAGEPDGAASDNIIALDSFRKK